MAGNMAGKSVKAVKNGERRPSFNKTKAAIGRTAGKKSVDISTFVRKVVEAHKKGLSQTWVAQELDITPAAVSLRIKYLRDQGVKNLPEFPRGNVGGTRLDVDALNDLVKKARA